MLLDRLRGQGEENDAMRAGTAFHSFLEHAQPGESVTEFDSDGIHFVLDLDDELAVPRVRECKTEKQYVVDGLPVTLVAKADTVEGRIVSDYKLSADFDAEKYTESMQWRAYLVLFDADRFDYCVFSNKRKGDTVTVTDFDRMSFYRYPEVEADVVRCLKDLVRFMVKHVPERLTFGDEKILTF